MSASYQGAISSVLTFSRYKASTLESFRQPSFKGTKASLRRRGGCSYKVIVMMALKLSVSCVSETKEASTCKHVHKFQVYPGRWNADMPLAVNFSTLSSPSCAQNLPRTLPLRLTDRSSTRPPDLTPNHIPPTAEKQNVPISRPDRLVRPSRPHRGVLSLHVLEVPGPVQDPEGQAEEKGRAPPSTPRAARC